MKKLGRHFFDRNTNVVAIELLGKTLVINKNGRVKVRIVEVEAYLGSEDPGSHASRGMTPRNKLMFDKPGFTYIYFIYGNYHCLNFVTESFGTAGAVLVRGVEPLEGLDLMYKNRNVAKPRMLSNGPGKLTQALALTKDDSGIDIVSDKSIYLLDTKKEDLDIIATERIGITAGADLPYRYYIKGNEFVSDYKPLKQRRR